jgi:hypothetical protein
MVSIRFFFGRRACESMGRSREPLVFARFGGTDEEAKVARVAGYMPKRLPSRRWSLHWQAEIPTTRTRWALPMSQVQLVH